MNAKLMKPLVKLALGLAGSALIGTLIKMERQVGERIDDHFDSKNSEDAKPE